MSRRFSRIILPTLLIALVTLVMLIVGQLYLSFSYRARSNAQFAAVIGTLADEPDFNPGTVLHQLQDPDSAVRAAGEQILRDYGYRPSDFALSSADYYSQKTLLYSAAIIIIVIMLFATYLWHYDWSWRQEIYQLTSYLQKLNARVYDLQIKTNSEDEMSFLANELYKITVTLQESAAFDRALRRQLEATLADISHQLKTPLTSLQLALDSLYHDTDMPAEVRQDFLRSSNRQVSNMSHLITTLLNVAKFDNKTVHLQRRVMPIREIIVPACDNLEVLAELDGINFDITGELDAEVKLDPRWQIEALTNIIKNCLEHSDPGETVFIRVKDTTLFTRVTIEDHGEGIAPEDLHHIFQRFYKAKNASPTSVGIGLPFAKSIIEADQGQIRVTSTLGVGTKFQITYFH